MNSIAWSDGKGRPREETPRVVVIAKAPERFWLLDQPVGVLLHWVGKRSYPHMLTECPHCGQPGVSMPRQHFYCAALQHSKSVNSRGRHTWQRCVLSLSDRAELDLSAVWQPEYAISQLIVETWREKDSHDTQRLKIAECVSAPCADPGFDVRPVLLNMWKVRTYAPCNTEYTGRIRGTLTADTEAHQVPVS